MFYNKSTNLNLRKVFTMKKFRKILAAMMALTMMTSTVAMTACEFLGGSRELSSIVVTNGSISTSYTLNETVSFEEMVITAKYNDASTETVAFENVKVYLNDEDITNDLNKITATVGTKTVVIEYEGKKAMITITVSSKVDDGGNEGGDGGNEGGDEGGNEGGNQNPPVVTPIIVAGFEAPGSYTTHLNQKKAAGTAAYGEEGYEAQFAIANDIYMAGDDNAFKFLPQLRFLNENDQPETAVAFKSQTTVSLYNGTDYVALESRNGEEANVVEYYKDETVYLTANVTNNTYDFADAAIGQQFKLSVLPQGNYMYTGKAVDCEVTVVDGFNVYTAKQLAVIDNDTDEDRAGYWDDIKEAEGLTDVNPAAIVIQNDITMTANDIPAAFQYTLEQEVKYYREADAETKANPIAADKTFLYDLEDIFSRIINNGQSFKIYGNYFNLNLGQMPLVCSFANEFNGEGYGSDGSNTQLLRIVGEGTLDAEPTGIFEMKNLNVKGNANISDYVYVTESGEALSVYAGGLIFVKTIGVNSVLDNVLARTNFVTFFPEGENANMALKNSKAYDSYANAAFVWGKNTFTIENCDMARAGGPLILAQHVDPEDKDGNYSTITADEKSTFKNLVTGKEFWFNSYGAGSVVANLRALNAAVVGVSQSVSSQMSGGQQVITNSFMTSNDDNGKLNMIYLLMPNGTDTTIVGKADVEGSFSYKGYEATRVKGTTMGDKVHTAFATNAGMGFGISFNLKDGFMHMQPDASGNLTPVPDPATVGNFVSTSESYLGINLGAFTLFVEYFQL